jgi:TonB-dependent starch-binding outer membrane protein SusC
MYKDLNGADGTPDGKVTADHDRTIIGNPWPKIIYALNLNASYKGLVDISIQFQGVQGVDIFNANKAYSRNFFGDDNSTTDIFEAWTPDVHTNNPRNVANDPNGNFSKPSTYFIEDGSYLKLRNIQVGFNFPSQWLSKVKLKRTRLYVTGNNLLTITKYSGLDPEIAGSNTSRGVDYGMYPQVRTFSAGIEVQF